MYVCRVRGARRPAGRIAGRGSPRRRCSSARSSRCSSRLDRSPSAVARRTASRCGRSRIHARGPSLAASSTGCRGAPRARPGRRVQGRFAPGPQQARARTSGVAVLGGPRAGRDVRPRERAGPDQRPQRPCDAVVPAMVAARQRRAAPFFTLTGARGAPLRRQGERACTCRGAREALAAAALASLPAARAASALQITPGQLAHDCLITVGLEHATSR